MKKRYQITLVVLGCLIALLGLSYAYFLATSNGGGPGGSVSVNTVTLDEIGFQIEGVLEFNDLDILPGHKNISKIKATAIGANDIINYKLVWEGTNTLNTPLKYTVYKTTTDETPSIECKKEIEMQGASKIYYESCTENNFTNLGSIITSGEISKTESSKEFILAGDEVIKGTEDGNVVYYYVVLEYPNLNESQNIDIGGGFDGNVTVKKTEEEADLNIKKIYLQSDSGYTEVSSIPSNGYMLNNEKSTCTNGAIPSINNKKLLITNLTSSNTECNLYFDKDNEKPIISNISAIGTETEITVTVESTDNLGVTEYWYKIDDNDYIQETNNTYKFTGLDPSTSHTISVYVKDASGNMSEISTISAATVDLTKPTIEDVTSETTMNEINVTVTASDNVGISEYWYSIDNGEFIQETSNSHKFTGLTANTEHTIKVYVKDAVGNTSETVTKIFKTAQDEEAPVINDIATNATETEIDVTVDATDNIGVTEYWYQLDSNEAVKGIGNTYKFTGLGANTEHIINVYVKDATGNTSETITKVVKTVDVTKPVVNDFTTSGSETEITVTVDATDNVGVTEYYFAMNDGTFNKVTTNTFKFAGLTAGANHIIKVYVKDASGNTSDTFSKQVTVPDNTNPIVSNITTSVTETTINAVVSATDNTEVTEWWYAIDGNEFVKGTGNTYIFTGLSASTTHTIKVYVKDKFGNQSSTLSTTATTIDSTKPTISKLTATTTESSITVTVTASDNVGVTEYWYSIDGGSYSKGTGRTKTFSNLDMDTSYTISVYVKDAAGNQSNISTQVFYTDGDTEDPTISSVTTSTTETSITVNVNASDNVGVTRYCYKIGTSSYSCSTSSTKTFSSLSAGTSYTIYVYVKDAAGNQSSTTTKTVKTSDTTKPTISSVTITSITKNSIAISVSASDNVGVSSYCYQIGTGTVSCSTSSTKTFSSLSAGTTYSIKVYVKDAAGNQSSTTTKSATTDEDTITSSTIIANSNYKTTTPTFSNVATTDEGVYRVSDGMYGGYSYYWRGAVTNNYVKFANKCWRIVRINGDGSIRLIYDGTTCHANGTSTDESIAVANQAYNSNYNNSSYVGWTYNVGLQRTLSGTSTNAKTQLESWYSTNLSSYASKIADGKFCNDRNVKSGETWSATGDAFYYAAYQRLVNNKAPSLSCNSGDVYTTKIGLIIADEIAYAGGVWSTLNKSYYLYNGQYYWTMTPLGWTDSSMPNQMFAMGYNGWTTDMGIRSNSGLRPVINLKADTTFATGGTGTQSNPYVVQ